LIDSPRRDGIVFHAKHICGVAVFSQLRLASFEGAVGGRAVLRVCRKVSLRVGNQVVVGQQAEVAGLGYNDDLAGQRAFEAKNTKGLDSGN
jgi:hypothetical protein